MCFPFALNPLSVNPTKWSNTLKQFVSNLPTNCLSVVDHFVGLALKGLTLYQDKRLFFIFVFSVVFLENPKKQHY